jgi:hypothetical protein
MSAACPTGDGNQTQEGQSLCPGCADRLWAELRWLADMYPQLLPALTHRVNIEYVDRDKIVRVAGGKDPMVRGMDLHEDALGLRTTIRSIAYSGLGWVMERGLVLPAGLSTGVSETLRFVAKNLHWVLSDNDPDRISQWAARAIGTRLEAETLVTPAVAVRKIRTNQVCGHGDPGCSGDLIIWGSEPVARCQINPAHTVSRETLIFRLVTGSLTR